MAAAVFFCLTFMKFRLRGNWLRATTKGKKDSFKKKILERTSTNQRRGTGSKREKKLGCRKTF